MVIAVLFSVVTFAASWLLWAAAAAAFGGDFAHPIRFAALGNVLYLAGVFAPAIVALTLTISRDGTDAARALLGRAAAWNVGPRFYLFAILFYPLARLGAAALQRGVLGAWPATGPESLGVMFAATILSTPVQAGEELGWRGLLLPRLSARVGLPAASVIVGLVWAAWHLPFFFLAGTDKSGQSFPAYLAGVTALSVAMAWLYGQTNGSVLLTMLMHASVNNLRPMATPAFAAGHPFSVRAPFMSWAIVAVLWLGAVVLLIAMRRAHPPAFDTTPIPVRSAREVL